VWRRDGGRQPFDDGLDQPATEQKASGWPLAVFQALRTAEERAACAAVARWDASRIGSLEPQRGERAVGDASNVQGTAACLLIARSDEAGFARAGVALVQDRELHVGWKRAEARLEAGIGRAREVVVELVVRHLLQVARLAIQRRWFRALSFGCP